MLQILDLFEGVKLLGSKISIAQSKKTKRQYNKPLNRRLINLYCKMANESKSKRLRKKANKILESDWCYYWDKIGDYE